MKKNILFFTLFIFSLSFGQAKKVKTTQKSNTKVSAKKETTIEERNNLIKADPDSYATLDVGPALYNQPEDENTIYNPAGIEIKPEFPGGNEKLFHFISKNFQYTDEMKENELKGRVIASFVVEKDGSISDIKVIRGIGYGTEKEVVRILKLMPKWYPGEQNGKKVRCSYTMPITIYGTK